MSPTTPKYSKQELFRAGRDEYGAIGAPWSSNPHNYGLVQGFRAYKSTPHSPNVLFLKYAINRIENADVYRKDPEEIRAYEEAWLRHHQKGKAKEKNGHITLEHLHSALHHYPDIIPELLQHKKDLHDTLREFSPHLIKKINGVDSVPLARGIKSVKKIGADHELASYTDDMSTAHDFYDHGGVLLHHWVPLRNIWYSYDHGPSAASSHEFGNENEWVVSNHPRVDSKPEDIENLLPRNLHLGEHDPNVQTWRGTKRLPNGDFVRTEDDLKNHWRVQTGGATDDEVVDSFIEAAAGSRLRDIPQILQKNKPEKISSSALGRIFNLVAKPINPNDTFGRGLALGTTEPPPEFLERAAKFYPELKEKPEALAKIVGEEWQHAATTAMMHLSFHKQLPIDILDKYGHNDVASPHSFNEELFDAIHAHPKATPELLNRVLDGAIQNSHDKGTTRFLEGAAQSMAKHPNTTNDLLNKIQDQHSWLVRKLTGSHPDGIPSGQMEYPHLSPNTQNLIAQHPNANEINIAKLKPSGGVDADAIGLWFHKTPPDTIVNAIIKGHPIEYQSGTLNSWSKQAHLAELANHPNLTLDHLKTLKKHGLKVLGFPEHYRPDPGRREPTSPLLDNVNYAIEQKSPKAKSLEPTTTYEAHQTKKNGWLK